MIVTPFQICLFSLTTLSYHASFCARNCNFTVPAKFPLPGYMMAAVCVTRLPTGSYATADGSRLVLELSLDILCRKPKGGIDRMYDFHNNGHIIMSGFYINNTKLKKHFTICPFYAIIHFACPLLGLRSIPQRGASPAVFWGQRQIILMR